MHPFLSDEWFEAAIELHERYAGQMPETVIEVRVNQVITDVPFGDGTVHVLLDTSAGTARFEPGHVDEPDAVVTTDYETARVMLIDQDPAAAMQAFLDGRVRVQGDMMRLMAAQAQAAGAGNEAAAEMAAELRAITE